MKKDPDGMNDQRAQWAENTLEFFRNETGMVGEDLQTVLTDLLCDVMHLSDRADGSIDVDLALQLGAMHYEVETGEG